MSPFACAPGRPFCAAPRPHPRSRAVFSTAFHAIRQATYDTTRGRFSDWRREGAGYAWSCVSREGVLVGGRDPASVRGGVRVCAHLSVPVAHPDLHFGLFDMQSPRGRTVVVCIQRGAALEHAWTSVAGAYDACWYSRAARAPAIWAATRPSPAFCRANYLVEQACSGEVHWSITVSARRVRHALPGRWCVQWYNSPRLPLSASTYLVLHIVHSPPPRSTDLGPADPQRSSTYTILPYLLQANVQAPPPRT